TELGASFQLTLPQVTITTVNELAPADPLTPALPPSYAGVTLGFVFPFQGVLADWLYFGAVGYFPSLVLTHVRGYDPARPFLYAYDTYTDHYDVTLGFSLK